MTDLAPIPRSSEFVRCYGCGPANEHGLRLDFHLDEANQRVEARWRPDAHFAGYKTMVHGGIIATMIDEGMGWALWGLAQKTGVTRELKVRYLRPVLTSQEYVIRGWVERVEEGFAVVRSTVSDARGRVAAEGSAEWALISADKVRDR